MSFFLKFPSTPPQCAKRKRNITTLHFLIYLVEDLDNYLPTFICPYISFLTSYPCLISLRTYYINLPLFFPNQCQFKGIISQKLCPFWRLCLFLLVFFSYFALFHIILLHYYISSLELLLVVLFEHTTKRVLFLLYLPHFFYLWK